ncbi:MAG: hypothetical protein M1834_000153 [Cirrosporium novae-zelandiae]|nr:MAG: hypothetical protein M1834_000153 [Cirrosporium novae-zelandiae]
MAGGMRSKGCRTCRMRHVKCDEAKPTCQRCQKAKMECRGYTPVQMFVDEAPRILEAQAKASAKKKLKQVTESNQDTTLVRRCISIPSGLAMGVFSNALLMNLDLSAFAQDIYHTFLFSHLFDGPSVYNPNILSEVAYTSTSNTPSVALDALARMYFGKMNNCQRAIEEGTKLYGTSLRQFKQDIATLTSAYSHWVLTTAMTLEIYECIAFTSTSGWLQHAGGIGALVLARGPSRHQKAFEHNMFRSSRMIIILACLTRRQHTFLEQEEWKTIPWALQPKSPSCYLIDILSNVPGFLADSKALEDLRLSGASQGLISVTRAKLTESVITQLQKLYDWRWNWESANASTTIVASADASRLKPAPFSTILTFTNVRVANAVAVYDAVALLLLRLLSTLHPDESPFSFVAPKPPVDFCGTNPLLLPGDPMNLAEIALEICRTVDYHLWDGHSSVGAFAILFPLRIACTCLSQVYEEVKGRSSHRISGCNLLLIRKWMREVERFIVEGNGFALGSGVFRDIGGYEVLE